MDNYDIIRKLDRGAEGLVYLAKRKSLSDRKSDKPDEVVVKEIFLGKRSLDSMQEATLLKKLKHPHVLRYLDSFIGPNREHLYIVTEYCSGGNLSNRIAAQSEADEPFTEDRIMLWVTQILFGLHYIHQQRILHRDLKTANIFIKHHDLLCVGDLGVAAQLEHSLEMRNSVVGTPYYLSPEVCQDIPYNTKSDCWSFGCIIYELCCLTQAFKGNNLLSLATKICAGAYAPIAETYSPELRGLVSSLLQPEPEDRPTTSELLYQSAYVNTYVQRMSSEFEALYLAKRKHSLQYAAPTSPVSGPNSAHFPVLSPGHSAPRQAGAGTDSMRRRTSSLEKRRSWGDPQATTASEPASLAVIGTAPGSSSSDNPSNSDGAGQPPVVVSTSASVTHSLRFNFQSGVQGASLAMAQRDQPRPLLRGLSQTAVPTSSRLPQAARPHTSHAAVSLPRLSTPASASKASPVPASPAPVKSIKPDSKGAKPLSVKRKKKPVSTSTDTTTKPKGRRRVKTTPKGGGSSPKSRRKAAGKQRAKKGPRVRSNAPASTKSVPRAAAPTPLASDKTEVTMGELEEARRALEAQRMHQEDLEVKLPSRAALPVERLQESQTSETTAPASVLVSKFAFRPEKGVADLDAFCEEEGASSPALQDRSMAQEEIAVLQEHESTSPPDRLSAQASHRTASPSDLSQPTIQLEDQQLKTTCQSALDPRNYIRSDLTRYRTVQLTQMSTVHAEHDEAVLRHDTSRSRQSQLASFNDEDDDDFVSADDYASDDESECSTLDGNMSPFIPTGSSRDSTPEPKMVVREQLLYSSDDEASDEDYDLFAAMELARVHLESRTDNYEEEAIISDEHSMSFTAVAERPLVESMGQDCFDRVYGYYLQHPSGSSEESGPAERAVLLSLLEDRTELLEYCPLVHELAVLHSRRPTPKLPREF
eukprot:m.160123 g.160123  ORF g.160123 m.160123 type:complete len:929 (+) comp16493_c0_seq2:224-3010(+)